MPTLETHSSLLHYREEGTGVPVVMLHATLHDHHDFDGIFDSIARGIGTCDRLARARIVDAQGCRMRFDVPGRHVARSCADTQPRSGRVRRQLGRCVGSSAARYHEPRRGRSARTRQRRWVHTIDVDDADILSRNGIVDIGSSHPAAAVPRYMRAMSTYDNDIERRVIEKAGSADGRAIASALWRSFAQPDYDLRARATSITAPTLLIWGNREIALPIKDAHCAQAALPQATLVEFATGHVPFASRPRSSSRNSYRFSKPSKSRDACNDTFRRRATRQACNASDAAIT